MKRKDFKMIIGMAFTLLFMVNCAPAQFDESLDEETFEKQFTDTHEEEETTAEIPTEDPFNPEEPILPKEPIDEPIACLTKDDPITPSGSLIGTGYHFCITDPVEVAGIYVGLIVTPNSPAPIFMSYKRTADECCSKQLEITAMASGCVLGVVAVRCK